MAELTATGKHLEPVQTKALKAVTPPPVVKTEDPDSSASDNWLAQHPENQEFKPSDAPASTEPKAEVPPSTEPGVEPQSTPPAGDTPSTPASVTADVAPQPEAKTEVKPTEAQPKVEAKPVETPEGPSRVTAEAKYQFDEGGDTWTGAQIRHALVERNEALPKAARLDSLVGFFGFKSADEVEAAWKPTLEALAAHQDRWDFINTVLFDATPEKFDYFQRCNAQYDTEVPPAARPSQPTQPAQSGMSVDERKQFDSMRAKIDAFEQERANQRVAYEMNIVFQKYPWLATDIEKRDAFVKLGMSLHQQDPRLGFLDAMKINAPMYDAFTLALEQNKKPVVEQPPAVPALNGSAGAAPGGAQPVNRNTRPPKYDDLNEAVDHWMATGSKDY